MPEKVKEIFITIWLQNDPQKSYGFLSISIRNKNMLNFQNGVVSYIFLSFSIAFFSRRDTYDREIPSFFAVSF